VKVPEETAQAGKVLEGMAVEKTALAVADWGRAVEGMAAAKETPPEEETLAFQLVRQESEAAE
jgi:hypothetical protein